MNTEAQYQALAAELAAIEKSNGGIYLTDENVDAENCTHCVRDSAEFWDAMVSSIKMNAGLRAEELGLNINAMLGRVIY
jgi:hypothetical protein